MSINTAYTCIFERKATFSSQALVKTLRECPDAAKRDFKNALACSSFPYDEKIQTSESSLKKLNIYLYS